MINAQTKQIQLKNKLIQLLDKIYQQTSFVNILTKRNLQSLKKELQSDSEITFDLLRRIERVTEPANNLFKNKTSSATSHTEEFQAIKMDILMTAQEETTKRLFEVNALIDITPSSVELLNEQTLLKECKQKNSIELDKMVSQIRQPKMREILLPLVKKYQWQSIDNTLKFFEREKIDITLVVAIRKTLEEKIPKELQEYSSDGKIILSSDDENILTALEDVLENIAEVQTNISHLDESKVFELTTTEACKTKIKNLLKFSEISELQKKNIVEQMNLMAELSGHNHEYDKTMISSSDIAISLAEISHSYSDIYLMVEKYINAFYQEQLAALNPVNESSREMDFAARLLMENSSVALLNNIENDLKKNQKNALLDPHEKLKQKEIYAKILALTNQLTNISLVADYYIYDQHGNKMVSPASEKEVKDIQKIIVDYQSLMTNETLGISEQVKLSMQESLNDVKKYITDAEKHPGWGEGIFPEEKKEEEQEESVSEIFRANF